MQMDEAEHRKKMWGDTSCKHPNLHKEYDRGIHTGDFVCEDCGRVFDSREDAKKDAEKNS